MTPRTGTPVKAAPACASRRIRAMGIIARQDDLEQRRRPVGSQPHHPPLATPPSAPARELLPRETLLVEDKNTVPYGISRKGMAVRRAQTKRGHAEGSWRRASRCAVVRTCTVTIYRPPVSVCSLIDSRDRVWHCRRNARACTACKCMRKPRMNTTQMRGSVGNRWIEP